MDRFDFEAVYALYPRKRGKKRGLDRARRYVKTEQDYANLMLAVKNYALEVQGTPDRYIKHFSSFMLDWEDWIDVTPPLDKRAIRAVVSGNRDYLELEEQERNWIQDNGGRYHLGNMSEYEFNRKLGD